MCKKCGKKGCGCNFKQPKRFDDIPDLTRSTQFYSQVYDIAQPSGNWKFDLGAVNDFVGLKVNNVDLGYIPMLTGNVSNLNEYVTDSAGDQWIIDVLGNAKKLAGGGGSGTVTNITAGSGMDFAAISASGAVTMGTPSSITLSSTNGFPSSTTHTHELSFGGTSSQVVLGDKTLGTYYNPTGKYVAMSIADAGYITNEGAINANSVLATSEIEVTNGANVPFPYGHLKTISNNTAYTWQLFNGINSTQIYTRSQIASSWSAWEGLGIWNLYTSTGYSPKTGITKVRSTDVGSGIGAIEIGDGGASWAGMVKILTPANLQVGAIGYYQDRMYYEATVSGGYHHFYGNYIQYENAGLTGVIDALRFKGSFYSSGDAMKIIWRRTDNILFGSVGVEYHGSEWANVFDSSNGKSVIAVSGNHVITAQSNGYTRIHNRATGTENDIAIYDSNGVLKTRTVSSLPFTNNTGTVTNFSASDLTTGFPYPLFTVNVTNPTTIPHLSFTLPSLPQKFVFAAPWGTTGTPLWRQLLPSDLQRDGANPGDAIIWNNISGQWEPGTAGGGVSIVTSGNFSPLFNVSVATNTTTPAFSFAAISQSQRLVYASPNSGSGNPSFRTLLLSDIGQSGAVSGEVMAWNGTTWAPSSNLASKWTSTGGDIYRASNVMIGSTTAPGYTLHVLSTVGGVQSNIMAENNAVSGSGLANVNLKTAGTGGHHWYFQTGNTSSGLAGNLRLFNQNQGAEYMTFRINGGGGNVGIFKAVPTSTLHIGGDLAIDSIATGSTSVNILTSSGSGSGTIQSRTIASMGIVANGPVWYVQGGTTDATTNAQDIVRTGKVRIGAAGTSGYMLSVVGDAYISSGVIVNNNTSYAAFSTGAVATTLIRLDTSNRVQLAQTSTDIILPSYLNTRNDAAIPSNYLYTTSAGVLQSGPTSDIVGSFRTAYLSGTQNGTTTFTALNTSTGFLGNAGTIYTTSGSNIVIPAVGKYHRIDITFDWLTNSGAAGLVNFEIQGKVGGSNITNQPIRGHAESSGLKGTFHAHWVTSQTGSVTVEFRYYTTGGAIQVNAKQVTITVRDYGFVPP